MDIPSIMRYMFCFILGLLVMTSVGMITGFFERDYRNFYVLYNKKWECNSYETKNENVSGKWVTTYDCVEYRRVK